MNTRQAHSCRGVAAHEASEAVAALYRMTIRDARVPEADCITRIDKRQARYIVAGFSFGQSLGYRSARSARCSSNPVAATPCRFDCSAHPCASPFGPRFARPKPFPTDLSDPRYQLNQLHTTRRSFRYVALWFDATRTSHKRMSDALRPIYNGLRSTAIDQALNERTAYRAASGFALTHEAS